MALAVAQKENAAVINIDSAAAQKFDECVARLDAIMEGAGLPLDEISRHPSVRPIVQQMRELLDQMGSTLPVAEETPVPETEHLATVTDIFSRRKN